MPVAAPGDESTAECTVTSERIQQFAEITGDDNPLHVDEAYASEGVFGEPVAHGMWTAGVVSAALANLPGDIVYVEQTLDFEAPVSPGSTVVAGCEVLEIVHDDRVRVRTTASVDGDRVLSGEAVVLSLPHEG